MNGYCAFFKKEMMENLRTYKFLILALVFLALGIMSPLSAKYLPDLVAAFLPEGANLGIGEPAILDSWAQFFKNVPQIGLIVLVILFSTMLSAEFTKGTLVNFVTKGLSRSGVILAKSTAALLIWTVCYGLAFGVSLLYGWIFWKTLWPPRLGFAVFLVWAFGALLIQLLLLGGTLTKGSSGSLFVAGGAFLAMMLLQLLPPVRDYLPVRLVMDNMELLNGNLTVSDFLPPLLICAVLAVSALAAAIWIMRRKTL